jgi:hypothetical protein
MKLDVDFSALHKAVAPLGHVISDFSVTSDTSELESIGSHLNQGMVLGKDIQLDEIDGSNGVLNFDGHQVMLYIPDQGGNISSVLSDGKQKVARRVHVAECKTIIGMRERGRFNDRYDVISRIDGFFPVFGSDYYSRKELQGDADLAVCQNCLVLLNHKNFSQLEWSEKSQFINTFSYATFFESYTSYFKTLPKSTAGFEAASYTANWSSISSELRSDLDYCCEQCGVNLTSAKQLLHTHHINGNKTNNERNNLRVLCADCHKKQPHHGHVYVSHIDVLKINQLRREQHKFDVFDYKNLLECADTALNGLIQKCQSTRLPGAELGIVIQDQEKFVSIDLCWPRRKVAVLIDVSNLPILQRHGWTVFTAFDALSSFEIFQSKIR